MTKANLESGALIAVDWGTSRFRARLLDARGNVVDAAESDDGIGKLAGGHEELFESLVAGWPQVPAIMAGMIGSRQGWREAAYAPCPATIAALAGEVTRFETGTGRPVVIVPGLMLHREDRRDVIRGEETQIVGLMELEPDFEGLCIMPGTHSKWVQVRRGEIPDFQTFLTGELFELLAGTSFLRHSVAQGHVDITAEPDFAVAVRRVIEDRPFAATLFSVRARQLLDGVSPKANRAYLSGLIIGGEIAAARTLGLMGADGDVRLVGGTAVGAAYMSALSVAGYTARAVDGGEAAFRGLSQIAAALDLRDQVT